MSTDQPLALRGFAGAIEVTPEAEARKAELVTAAKEITAVNDDASQLVALDAERGLKSIRTQTEAARKAVKAPILELGKKIDAAADKFIADAAKQELRLAGLVNDYQQLLHRQRQEAEQAAERERQRIANEAAAAIAASEAAERARKAAELATTQQDKDRLSAQATALEEDAFLKSLESESAPLPIVPVIATPKGVTVKPTFDYRILGANEYEQRDSLIRLARQYPHLVNIEARRADILDIINRAGIKELPGLEVHEVLKVNIR